MWDRRWVGLVCGAALALGLGVFVALALAAPGALQVSGPNTINCCVGMDPVASAAGPAAGDMLIAGDLNLIAAVNASNGQLDPNVASGSTLPLPSALPMNADVSDVTFGNGSIYATFFNGNIYIVSWNSAGALNSGFGTGGMVTVSPPASDNFGAALVELVGGNLVLATSIGNGGEGITLYPIDPTNGTVGAPASSPLPSGTLTATPDKIAVGPDGNVYIVGESLTSGMTPQNEGYYGIFNPSTLALASMSSQTTFAGSTHVVLGGQGLLAFAATNAYLAVQAASGATELWSAPDGSVAVTQGETIPTQVSGDTQTFAGLNGVSGGLLDVVLFDQNSQTQDGSSWALQTDGSTFGPVIQIGGDDTRVSTAAPGAGEDPLLSGWIYTVIMGSSGWQKFWAAVLNNAGAGGGGGGGGGTGSTGTTTPPPTGAATTVETFLALYNTQKRVTEGSLSRTLTIPDGYGVADEAHVFLTPGGVGVPTGGTVTFEVFPGSDCTGQSLFLPQAGGADEITSGELNSDGETVSLLLRNTTSLPPGTYTVKATFNGYEDDLPSMSCDEHFTIPAGKPQATDTTASDAVTCPAEASHDCAIKLELETANAGVFGVRAAKATTKTRTLNLGTTTARLKPGQTKKIRVSLNGLGRRLLARLHVLTVTLVITEAGREVDHRQVTFKAKRSGK